MKGNFWSHTINTNSPTGSLKPKYCFCKVNFFNGTNCEAMIDSGSPVSVADESLIPLLSEYVYKNVRLFSIDGRPLHVLGYGLLSVKIQNIAIKQYVIVLKRVSRKLLLGMDFWLHMWILLLFLKVI